MSGLVRRRRALGLLVTACFVCTGAGVGSALVVKSPAQAAADTAPPPASVLTAAVERRVISQSLITRGEVTASQHVDVSAGPQADKDIGRSVVTKVEADPGQRINAGQVLLEVSGRPLFVLKGALPAYRDLARGKRGEDVAQAQAALRAAGHPTGTDPSGVFGAGTEKAVASFYRSIGYEAPTAEAPTAEASTAEAPATRAASAGPVLPISEVVFVRSFPARVDDVRAKVGDEAGEGLMSLSAGALTVEAAVTLQQKGMIRSGQEVRVHSETTGRQFTGTVTSVGKETDPATDGGQDTGAEKYTVEVTPSKPLPSELNGENVQVTVVAASSKGKVLAVPSSAVSTGADGLTSVTEREDGGERRIPVTVGVSGDGFVQVTPREGTRLEAGAEVVVGVQPRAAVGGP